MAKHVRFDLLARGEAITRVNGEVDQGRWMIRSRSKRELRTRLLLFTVEQRSALLRVLRLPDSARAEMVAQIWASDQASGLAGLLTDLQHDRFARTLVIGVLYEMDRET